MATNFMAPPPARLETFVECFFCMRDPTAQRLTTLLPDGTVSILFNLGEPQKVVELHRRGEERLFKRAWIAGLRDIPVKVGPTDGVHLAGISFKPGGVFPFLQVPLSEFSNQVIELDSVWGRLAEEICERLFEAPGSGDRSDILADLLRQRGADAAAHPGVQFCLQEMSREFSHSISDISQRIGVSHKHLNRLFQKHVGLNPKTVSRILRFQKAVRILEGRGETDWAGLAVEAGFYDQAHMIAEFRRFCGLTPAAYQRLKAPDGNLVAA